VGPSHNKPGDNDGGEDEIIGDAAELPKADGVGEGGAGGDEWRLGRGG